MAKISEYLGNLLLLIIIIQFLPAIINMAKRYYTSVTEPRTQVAYLAIKGELSDSTYYVRELKKFFENREVKAILLKIECPGGAAGTSQAIFNEINHFKKEHPKTVVAFVENVCASGGYYVASAADYIIAEPSSFIGSIGSYISYPQLHDFIEQYKVHWRIIKTGIYKAAGNPMIPTTKEVEQMLQGLSDDTYRQFTHDVALHRTKLSLKNTDEWANGRVFTGYQAMQVGLIDELGSQSTAIAKIKEKESIEGEIEWVKPTKLSTFAKLFGQEEDSGSSDSLLSKFADSFLNVLIRRSNMTPIQ